jgi:hypothetical protein
MKKYALVGLILLSSVGLLSAQEEKGFKKENLFTGGSLTASFFNGQTLLGADPMFGYKIADWIDAGVAFNFLYNGERDYYEFDDRVRQTTYGPGVFTRIYPVKFLFVQAQFEHNFTNLKYIPAPGSTGFINDRIKTGANSMLLGGGFAQGREGSNSFYYIALMVDVIKNINSPYVNVAYNPDNPSQQRVTMAPIIRAGINIALFQGSRNR